MKCKMRLISMVIITALLFSGCQALGKKNENKTLTICVDAEVDSAVSGAVNMFERFYKIPVTVEIIPTDASAAEAKVTKIRTQMLAGEGPDVFIMKSPDFRYVEKEVSLFDNPELALRSDTFLPLDDYIANATYIDISKWNKQMMDAGKTDDGQMVIPLTYSYYGYIQDTEALNKAGDIPTSWDAFCEWDNAPVKGYTQRMIQMAFSYIFGNLCDYDTGELLYSEDDIYDTLVSADTYYQEKVESEQLNGVHVGMPDSLLLDGFNGSEDRSFFILPNVDGGTSAMITTYAAVNANTKDAKLAFSFVDILCSDEYMGGLGFPQEGLDYNLAAGWSSSWMSYGMLVYEEAFIGSLYFISDEEDAMIEAAEANIDSVRFMSNMDWELRQLLTDMIIRQTPDLDETALRESIRATLNSWELQLKE